MICLLHLMGIYFNLANDLSVICHPSLQCISVLLINFNINYTTGFALDTVWRSYAADINSTEFANYCCSTYWDLKKSHHPRHISGNLKLLWCVCHLTGSPSIHVTPVRNVSIIWTKYVLFFIGHQGTGLNEIVKESLSTNAVENIVCKTWAMLLRKKWCGHIIGPCKDSLS